MDSFDQWRAFVTVATLRSFAGAARTLGRSPQAVTRAIAALEARRGTRLLNRTTRAVSLTSEGERTLERARHALGEIERLEAGEDAAAPLAGRVSVTAPALFGQLHVVPVVVEFLRSNPGVDVRLVLLDRVVSLAEEGIDVAIRIGSLPDSSLRVRTVGAVRALLCASPAYLERVGVPRTPDALAKHDCITFAGTTPNAERWSFSRHGKRQQAVRVRSRLVVNSGPAAIDAALGGLGIVRVLSYQVARLIAERKLRPVLTAFERESLPVQVVHLPGAQTRVAAAFNELASQRLRRRIAVPNG